MKFLRGKKTYIAAAVGAIAAFAYQMGWITEEMFEAVMAFDIPAMIVFLRAGIQKAEF